MVLRLLNLLVFQLEVIDRAKQILVNSRNEKSIEMDNLDLDNLKNKC